MVGFDSLETPFYICYEDRVVRNLELLKKVRDESGAKVLCALKGFAFSPAMSLVAKYLDGFTSSGLFESKFASEFALEKSEIHTFSPAFKDSEIDEILALSKHIVFNSQTQWQKFRTKAMKSGVKCGLRVNPESSFSPTDAYNPCGKFSRLGMRRKALDRALSEDEKFLDGISGFHFHVLCEESANSLRLVLEEFEEKFGEFLPSLEWVNFGGGHHITREFYDVDLLISLVKNFREKYGVEVYLEPGEAVGWQTGDLVATVLDIVENETKIAILDTSAEAHMPDTELMPYRPEVLGEILGENGGESFEYRLGGNTCLAGDIMGLRAGEPVYRFKNPLKVGDRVVFKDQIHYTIVKNTTFNGIKLPNLVFARESGEILKLIELGYDEYRRRN